MEVSGYMSYFDPAGNPQWYVIAIILQTVALLIYGLILSIGRALHMIDLQKWAKGEMFNTFATFLMVVFLILLLQQIEGFSLNYFLGVYWQNPDGTTTNDPELVQPGATPIGAPMMCGSTEFKITSMESSLDLLKCRLATKAHSLASIQSQLADAARFALTMLTLYFSLIGVPILQGGYFESLFKEAESYRLMNQTITVILISLNALIVTIDYVKNNMLNFYLPVGLFLRSFHYTRGIGAFFIALALGFYFIYPVVYIITDPTFVKPTYTPGRVPMGQNTCYPTFSSVVFSIVESASGSVSAASEQISLQQLKNDIALIYSSILLRPFLVLALTLIFVRYFMQVLGGEPMELMRGLGKVL